MLCEINASLSLESGFTDLAKYINVCMEMTKFEATKYKWNIDWMLCVYKILFPICVYIKKNARHEGKKNHLKKKKHEKKRWNRVFGALLSESLSTGSAQKIHKSTLFL